MEKVNINRPGRPSRVPELISAHDMIIQLNELDEYLVTDWDVVDVA